ncbi:LysR family transcriptional regulator [Alteromonas sp. CYL-A6]|uniref:LysR family transcriptional regulator n=1 Tax=Alteromonas nitratireducens TaxID=3390813 RepID=UPI0034A7B6E5
MQNARLFEKLDLNLLKVFEALWHHRNMTRAADALHLTPSAVSHAVTRLRSVLDDPLFERRQQIMAPTPACERLAPEVLNALSGLRQAFGDFTAFAPATSHQRFTLAMPESMELRLLVPLLERLHASAPHVGISSVRLNRETLKADLTSGALSLALDVGRAVTPQIRHQRLYQDTFCVLMRHGHPLQSAMSRDAYLASQHISVSSRREGAAVEELGLQQLGITRQALWRCQTYRAAADVVASTDALLTLPVAVAQSVMTGRVVREALPFDLPPLDTHLYWHQQQEGDPGLHWLIGEVTSVFALVSDAGLTS